MLAFESSKASEEAILAHDFSRTAHTHLGVYRMIITGLVLGSALDISDLVPAEVTLISMGSRAGIEDERVGPGEVTPTIHLARCISLRSKCFRSKWHNGNGRGDGPGFGG